MKHFMDCNWIFNGQKIQEDLGRTINVKMAVEFKEKEVAQDKTDGEGMIDGAVDNHLMIEDLPVIVEIKNMKTLFLYVPEI